MHEKGARWSRLYLVLVALVVGLGLLGLGYNLGQRAQAAGAEPGTEGDPLVSKSYVDQFTVLQVVNLPKGQKLIADAGAELVLRSGTATAIGSQLGGLADVTAGKDLGTGQAVPANHLLIVPRTDGRGLAAVTDCILLVRGPFTIKAQ